MSEDNKPENPSKLNNISLIDKIPDSVYKEYFEHIKAGKSVYALLKFDGKDYVLFIEGCKRGDISGIVRVFYRENDLEQYALSISHNYMTPIQQLKFWTITPYKLAAAIAGASLKSSVRGKGIFESIATIIHNNEMRDLDVFWTAAQSNTH